MLRIITLAFISLLLLSACSGRLFTVHKIDVQQGNAIDPKKVEKLEIGMTKEQVKFLMGPPLITDVFHPDRWDYIYHLIPDYGDSERRHLVVWFEGDTVANLEKSDIPEPEPEVIEEATEESTSEEPEQNDSEQET